MPEHDSAPAPTGAETELTDAPIVTRQSEPVHPLPRRSLWQVESAHGAALGLTPLTELAERAASVVSVPPVPKSLADGCTVEEVAADWHDGLGRLLLDSGISTEVAVARGYSVVTRSSDVKGYGFSTAVASLVSAQAHALLVPLWDIAADAKSPTSHQLRPKKPRKPANKYESVGGRTPVLDANPLMRSLVLDGETPLWVTEGARKADALATVGVPCINLAGVDAWRGRDKPGDKTSPSRPLPSWDAVPVEGRLVVICYDSDAATKPPVKEASRRLAAFLSGRGARVAVAQLADAADGSKQGIDDYLGAGGALDAVDMTPHVPSLDGDGRAEFRTDNTSGVLDRLRSDLGTGVLTGFFRRNELLVHVPVIGENGYQQPAAGGDGPAQVRPVTTPYLREAIHSRYFVWRMVRNVRTPSLPPQDPCNLAVEAAGTWTTVPAVDVVTHTPLLRPDGTVLASAGYDQTSRTLLLPPAGMELTKVPDKLTDAAVTWAVDDVLTPLLGDFPFEDDESRANMLALLLTPLLRLVIPPPYPLFIINAHQPGSGKTLLSQVARGLHGGVHRPELPQNDDELRKQVSGILATTTAPVVIWDNASAQIKSPVLAGLLTEKTWNDRLLGTNRDINAVNDRIWVTTGNNVSIGGDMARRCYWVSLDPQMERPETRPLSSFRHPDLLGFVDENRGRLLTALLVVARRWVDAGRPATSVRSDSYGGWASAIAGMLDPFGLTQAFIKQAQTPAALSEDDEELGALLRALYDLFGLRPFQLREVADALGMADDPAKRSLKDAMPAAIQKKLSFGTSDATKSLGWYLKNNERRFAAGLRVAKHGQGRGGSVWVIEST